MATSSVLITAKSQKPRDTIKAMPFLDLAAELRNLVYELVAEDTPIRLSSKKQTLINSSPLLLVATIETQVIDFHFEHVTTFLDNLSDKDAARLTGSPPTQAIRIELWAAPLVIGWVKIIPWLNKFEDSNEIASKIGFEYVWKLSAGKSGAGPELMGRDIYLLDAALSWMGGKDQSWKEWGKIKPALELGLGLCKG